MAFITLGVKYDITSLITEARRVFTSEFPITLPPIVLLRQDFTYMNLININFVDSIKKFIDIAKRTTEVADTLPMLRYIAANLPRDEIYHSFYLANEDRLYILECRDKLKERSRKFIRHWRKRTPACNDCRDQISSLRGQLEYQGLDGWHAEWDGEFCNETCRDEVKLMVQKGREDMWNFLVAISAD